MSGGANGWNIPQDMSTYLDQQDRRLGHEERRPRVTKAADLLGPISGPKAIQVDDLNGDLTDFNGWIVAPPGAANSPDSNKWWVGWVTASTEGGVMLLATFQTEDQPHQMWTRSWDILISGGRSFSNWTEVGSSGPPPTPVYVPTIQYGTVNIIPTANTPTDLYVTFPTAFPSGVVPNVQVTPYSTVPGLRGLEHSVTDVTNVGFRAWIYRTNTTSTTLAWQAVYNAEM